MSIVKTCLLRVLIVNLRRDGGPNMTEISLTY